MDYVQLHNDLLRDIEETNAALNAEMERIRPLQERLALLRQAEPYAARLAGRQPVGFGYIGSERNR